MENIKNQFIQYNVLLFTSPGRYLLKVGGWGWFLVIKGVDFLGVAREKIKTGRENLILKNASLIVEKSKAMAKVSPISSKSPP